MVIPAKIDDVFAMVEHIERNGARYYREVADEKGIDPKVRELLLELADMEDDHEIVFAAMRRKLNERDSAVRPAFEQEGEAVSYLRAMTDSGLIGGQRGPATQHGTTRSLSDVIRTAIELEKDSIAFYLGLKEMLLDEPDKRQVDEIIKEEMRHVVDLYTKLERG